MSTSFDVIVIGAGIAGASLAAELQPGKSVLMLEMEERAGYHSTGRSAAMYLPTYGPAMIQALTRASGGFFHAPPSGFADAPLLSPRGELMLVDEAHEADADAARALGLKDISIAEVRRLLPIVRPESFRLALFDPAGEDIDVDLLHQGFLRRLRRAGGQVQCDAAATGLDYRAGRWTVTTRAGNFQASVIVNAAGAWADEVAKLAGARTVGLQPKRRSAALVSPPEGVDISRWPLTFGAGETFYFKPMGGKIMISPADATPVEPHDAWADDMKIAEAIELYQMHMDHAITRLDHTWAGLRNFAPDGEPVVGYDPQVEGFFWLAGQGGYGIQTSPALSRTAAALICHTDLPADVIAEGTSAAAISPRRFHA
jgi:D-arginine dehydrogenase